MTKSLLVAAVTLLVLGCGGSKTENETAFDKVRAVAAGEELIGRFQGALKQELTKAMADGGPENAIAVCNVMAPQIADSFSAMPGVLIRRVSLRQRNIGFSPDEFEMMVLKTFEADGSTQPQIYGETTFDSAGVRIYRYMKEIKTGPMCLNCHGDPATFSPALKATLDKYYPDDPAVGYAAGDSRGAFSLTLIYPEAEMSVTQLLDKKPE